MKVALGNSLVAGPAEAWEGRAIRVMRVQVDLSRSFRGLKVEGVSSTREEEHAAQVEDLRDASKLRFQIIADQEEEDAVAEAVRFQILANQEDAVAEAGRLIGRILTHRLEHRAATGPTDGSSWPGPLEQGTSRTVKPPRAPP